MPALVLQPVDQAAGIALAQQLACWARTERGVTDPLVRYASCCASPTGASIGRWSIDTALCAEYGPPPFTGNNGEPIDCGPGGRPFYLIYGSDVPSIDPNTCEVDEPLPAPTGLTASDISEGSFMLTWGPAGEEPVLFAVGASAPEAHATVYIVEFSGDGGATWERLHIEAPPLVLDGLAAGTTYSVRVAAATRASERRLNWSDPITVTTKTRTPRIDLTWEPDRGNVFGVRVTASGANRITLDFGDGATKRTITGGQTVNHVYASAGIYTITASSEVTTMATTTVDIPWFTGTPTLTADKEDVDAAGDEVARTVTVTGSDFPPGYTGKIRLLDPFGGDVVAVDVAAGADGAIAAASLLVPEQSVLGDYLIVSTFLNLPVPDIPVTVMSSNAPVLVTDTSAVMAGEKIDVAGSGWPVQKTVRVGLFNGTTEVVGLDAATGDTGTFSGLFVQVPIGTGAGEYRLRAVLGSLVSNDVDIHVEDRHSLLLPSRTDLNSATFTDAERTIKVTGAVFPASTTGTVSLLTGAPGTAGSVVVSAEGTTDSEGTLSEVALVVPKATARGDHHLVAEFGSETSDDTPVTIRYPAGVITPPVIRKGESIRVTGTDFHPWPLITIWPPEHNGYQTRTSPDGTLDTRGPFTITRTGRQEVTFSVWHGNTIMKQPFIVLDEMKVVPDVTTVKAGTSFNVSGTGFAVSTTGTVGLYDGDAVIVEADVTTNDLGQFPSTPLLVPASRAPGAAQVRATVNGETSPVVGITIDRADPTVEWEPQADNVFGISVTPRGRDQFRVDFGDGTSDVVVGDGQATPHVYASAGSYIVTATAQDAEVTTNIAI